MYGAQVVQGVGHKMEVDRNATVDMQDVEPKIHLVFMVTQFNLPLHEFVTTDTRTCSCPCAVRMVPARHHPYRTHDLRSGSQDHHPSKNSVQKTIRS